ncbi:hypothetical protein ABTM64_21125, partial [Acinetobacter baumannii]
LEEQPHDFRKTPRLISAGGKRLSGQGLLTSERDRHRRLRAALSPLFTRPALNVFLGVIGAEAERAMLSWSAGGTIDMAKAL